MSVDLSETSLQDADFSSNNPERHNSDSSVEFLMGIEEGQEVNLVFNREPEQSSAQTNNVSCIAIQQVAKTTFSTKETLNTNMKNPSDVEDFIPRSRTSMLTLNEDQPFHPTENDFEVCSAEVFEKREEQKRNFIINSTIAVGAIVAGGLLYKCLLAKR